MAANPLAPLTAAQITNQIAGYTSRLPQPQSDQQIRLRAQGLLDPVVKSITDRSTAATKAAAGATAGYASKLADSLGSYDTSAHSIYGNAEQQQANSNNVQQSALRGGGQQLADALTSQMNSFGAGPDAVKSLGAAPAATGAGAANALLGSGSAALDQLIANEASSRDYGAKLPGLTRQQGASDVRDVTMSGNKALLDNVAKVQEQLPGILQSEYSANDTKQSNLAQAGEHVRELLNARNDAINAGQAKNATTVAVADAKAAAATAAAQAKQANSDRAYNLEVARTYGVDPKTGQPTLAAVKAAQAAQAKANKKTAGLSASYYAGLKLKANDAADTFYYGVPPKQHYDATKGAYSEVPNTGTPGVDYKTAITRLMTKYSLKPEDAVTIANEYYAPGERGRPAKAAPVPKPKPDTGFRQVKIPKGK